MLYISRVLQRQSTDEGLTDVSQLRSIRHVLEAGLVEYWLGQEIASTPQCLRSPKLDRQDGVSPLDMETLFGTMLVLLGGGRCGRLHH